MPETTEFTFQIEQAFELIGLFFDVFGVLVICVGVIFATFRSVQGMHALPDSTDPTTAPAMRADRRYKVEIGLSLLLGLEVLLAADIIKTVAKEGTA